MGKKNQKKDEWVTFEGLRFFFDARLVGSWPGRAKKNRKRFWKRMGGKKEEWSPAGKTYIFGGVGVGGEQETLAANMRESSV